MFIQSHTPFADLTTSTSTTKTTTKPLADKTILVTGGDGERCRQVAHSYGFKNVVIPADIITACPSIWPFASPQNYETHARPLPAPIYSPSPSSPAATPASRDKNLTIDAIFIFNDPRDWALDTQILLDVLLSDGGIVGTTPSSSSSPSQPSSSLPTSSPSHQQPQTPLYFSNPDLLFASSHPHPRLGQGAFIASFLGVWDAVTAGKRPPLQYTVIGKPSQSTFEFAEKRLLEHRAELVRKSRAAARGVKDGELEAEGEGKGIRKVYMVGDNPESDIAGGNGYRSPRGSKWDTVLVRSGVYNGGEPAHKPSVVVDDAWEAVEWALEKEGWLGAAKHELRKLEREDFVED
ncbi:MAG: hypothetical protein LQ346_005341 [Caloplaca aetnensis]|nr:MAG: hypothetical protein LQ346_005341 [Caloplaca aetnensis]